MCDRFIFLLLKHDDERAAFAAEAVLIVMCSEYVSHELADIFMSIIVELNLDRRLNLV